MDLKNTRTTLLNLYVGLGTGKYSNYLTGFGLTLFVYDILGLDLRNTQRKNYLTELGLILLNTGLEIINQPSRDVVKKVEDFFELSVFYLVILC